MSFESTWGFNPNEVVKAEEEIGTESETNDFGYSAAAERAARIPADEDSQIYQLRRMFRL